MGALLLRQYATSSLAREEALANVRQLVGTVDEIQRCMEDKGGCSTADQLREQEAALDELRRLQGDEAAERRAGVAELRRLQREAIVRQQHQSEQLAEASAEALGARREAQDVSLALQRVERRLSAVSTGLAAEISEEVRALASERLSEASAERQRFDALRHEASSGAAARAELAAQLERVRGEAAAIAATHDALEGNLKDSHQALIRRIDCLQVGALKERLSSLEAAHQKFECVYGHSTGQRIEWERHHAAVDRRMQQLERAAGSTADGLAAAQAELQDLQGRLNAELSPQERLQSLGELLADATSRLRDLEGSHLELRERHERAVRQRGAYEEHRNGFEERLQELEALRQGHQELQRSVGAERSAREDHRAAVEERLTRLETSSGEAAERQAAALEAACRRVQDCHEHIRREKDAQKQQQSSLELRIMDVERVFSITPDAHAQTLGLEDSEAAERGHQDARHQAGAEARERRRGSAEQGLLARVQAIVEGVVSRRTEELQAACEKSLSRSAQAGAQRESWEEQREAMERRLQHVEQLVKESVVVIDAAYQKLQDVHGHGHVPPERDAESSAPDKQQVESSHTSEAPGYRQVEGRLRRLQSKLAKAARERATPEIAGLDGQLLDRFVTLPASQAARMFVEQRKQ